METIRLRAPPHPRDRREGPRTLAGPAPGRRPRYFSYADSGNRLDPVGAPETPLFELQDLHVAVAGVDIVRGVDLAVRRGEVHALMGPNGSGKSTLANAILGNPDFQVTRGRILFKGEDVTAWPTDVRGKAGMFLAFQYPEEIPGVPVVQFLRQALSARKGIDLSVLELRVTIMEWMARLGMDPSFGDRYLNEGFSGGEKKRNEILQMAILEPEVAVLDETDSGLDIDALRIVARGIQEVRSARPELGVLLITHYQRILDELTPDRVHILIDGRIVDSGGPELARRLEEEGYQSWRS
ncbi:MAG: Fe-S cluster assembly ATPase SufC [Actinobacteria bacterium]|nr:MAG: Fe-S cluster assembly ATPase SufC [Actinomycetota bacterium]